MSDNQLIDLSGYTLVKGSRNRHYRNLLIVSAIFVGWAIVLAFVWQVTSPLAFCFIAFCVLAGSMFFVDRKLRLASICSKCGGELERRIADVDPGTCKMLGGVIDPVRFTAYGRSYGVDENEADSLLSSHETYVSILRVVAVCERCRRFHEIVVGLKVPLNDNDRWVVHEHEYGAPIPMDIAPGQTLTQFELESEPS
jgi:hypothetical protein